MLRHSVSLRRVLLHKNPVQSWSAVIGPITLKRQLYVTQRLDQVPKTGFTSGMDSAVGPDWLYRVLEENSTEKFRIEYDANGDDLSNHMSHGIISLFRLGADQARIEAFTQWYAKKLESPPPTDRMGDITNPMDLLGKRTRFNDLVSHYQEILKSSCQGDLQLLIQQEFPALSAGLYNAALHGLIQLGYGLSVRSERVVCEGLAYLHHSYVPLGGVDNVDGPSLHTLGKGCKNILDVLEEVRRNSSLREAALKESQGPNSRKRTRFQNKVGAILDNHCEEVLNYVHDIKFPDFWDPDQLSLNQVKRIAEWVLDCSLMVYVKSRRKNDFFFIHGVTGAWSLHQVLTLLTIDEDILKALRVYLSTLIAVYVTQTAPLLDADEEASDDFPRLIQDAIGKERDEHIYKLVQVCYERSKNNESLKDLYIKACNVALKYDLIFK